MKQQLRKQNEIVASEKEEEKEKRRKGRKGSQTKYLLVYLQV